MSSIGGGKYFIVDCYYLLANDQWEVDEGFTEGDCELNKLSVE